MNSTLQLLLNNDKLADILLYSNSALINPESEFKGVLTKELIHLFKDKYFCNLDKKQLQISNFKTALSQVNDQFIGYFQHDPSDCLSTILEALEEDTMNQSESIVDQIFRHNHQTSYICHNNHKFTVEESKTTITIPLIEDSIVTKKETIMRLITNTRAESLVLTTEEENYCLTLKDCKQAKPFETFEELEQELKREGKIRENSKINVLLNNKRIDVKSEIREFLNPDCEIKIIEIPKPREGNYNMKVVVIPEIRENASLQEIRELKAKSQFSIETSKNDFKKRTVNRAVQDKIQQIFGKNCETQVRMSVKRYPFCFYPLFSASFKASFRLMLINEGEAYFSENSLLVVEIKDIEEVGSENASYRVIKKYDLQKMIEHDFKPKTIEGGFPCAECGNKIVSTTVYSKVISSAEYNFVILNKFEMTG